MEKDSKHLIPEIPTEIIDAYNDNKLVIFIGAGISRLMGCKDWRGLANDLIDVCFESNLITYIEKEDLKNLDNKKMISIAYNVMKDNSMEETFKAKFKDALKCKDISPRDNPYSILGTIANTVIFVTTNADTLFDKYFINEKIYSRMNDFKAASLNSEHVGSLYHIHGIETDIDNNFEELVFTTEQYINRYSNRRFRKFLHDIFNNFTVLFLGYGLSEFELLDYVITNSDENVIAKHYILEGVYSHQKKMEEFLAGYYKKLRVNLITYHMDELGYEQQIRIFDYWINQIKGTSKFYPAGTERVDVLLSGFSIKRKRELFEIVKKDKYLLNYFLDKLPMVKDVFNWSKALVEYGYLKPENNPNPVESANKGYYSIPTWRALSSFNTAFQSSNKSREWKSLSRKVIDEFYKKKEWLYVNFKTNSLIISILMNYNPILSLSIKDIMFIRNSLDMSFNDGYIEHELLSGNLIDKLDSETFIAFTTYIIGFQSKTNKDIIQYISRDYLEEFTQKLVGRIDSKNAGILLSRINSYIDKILQIDRYFFSSISELDRNYKNPYYDYESFICELLIKCIDVVGTDTLNYYVGIWVKSRRYFLHQLALFAFRYRYVDIKNTLWTLKRNPFNFECRYELYNLVKTNSAAFSEDELCQMVNWINNSTFNRSLYIDEPKIRRQMIAHDRILFLEALSDNDAFDYSILEKHKQIYSGNIYIPEKIDHNRAYLSESSPLSLEQMKNMTFKELVDYLKTQEGVRDYNTFELSNEFKQYIANNFENVSDNLFEFKEVPQTFLNNILFVIESKKQFIIESNITNKVLDFLGALISQSLEGEREVLAIKGVLNCMYGTIVRNEKRSEPDIYQRVIGIIQKCLQLDLNVVNQTGNSKDLILEALNDTYGIGLRIIFDCLNLLSNSFNTDEIKVSNDNFSFIVSIINDRSMSRRSFSVVIGLNIPTIYHINQEWTLANLKSLFDISDMLIFSATMQGYLSSRSFYELDDQIINQDYYRTFIEECIEIETDKKITDNLGDRVVDAYFRRSDESAEKLLEVAILIKNQHLLDSMIHGFIRRFNNKAIVPESIKKIKAFWETYNNIFDGHEGIKFNHFIFKIIKEIDTIDIRIIELIDDSLEKVKGKPMYDTFLYSGLYKHKANYTAEIGELVYKAIEYNTILEYEQDGEKIYDFVEYMMQNNAKEVGNKLCIQQIKKGHIEFRDLYNKYNQNSFV